MARIFICICTALTLFINFSLAQDTTEIVYDSGADRGGILVEGQVSVRFTPDSYPVELQSILYYRWDSASCGEEIQYSVWTDSLGANEGPQRQLIPNTNYSVPISQGFEEIDISSHNLVIESGDFYLSLIKPTLDDSLNLCLGSDTYGEAAGRAWWGELDGSNWTLMTSWVSNLVIRAKVTTPAITRISEHDYVLPNDFELKQNYPNPFNPETIINFEIPQQSTVQIKIYNLVGQLIRVVLDAEHYAGKHTISWDGKDSAGNPVSGGVYLYKIQAGRFTQVKKMTLLR